VREKNCIYFKDKHVENILTELDGCTEWFKIGEAVFPFFNHLEVYFPEAYQHMLKVLDIEEEIENG
jgi:hypothetical protein